MDDGDGTFGGDRDSTSLSLLPPPPPPIPTSTTTPSPPPKTFHNPPATATRGTDNLYPVYVLPLIPAIELDSLICPGLLA
ncbi:hypothetical protein B0H11DRAFT_2222038 [Mycena galericulata]|nr:hypothetical protein B0H11DRAFT_2222038 [Mycena galericulata]